MGLCFIQKALQTPTHIEDNYDMYISPEIGSHFVVSNYAYSVVYARKYSINSSLNLQKNVFLPSIHNDVFDIIAVA